jgi:DNA invertase Pin-like site-specific DNA recombinase
MATAAAIYCRVSTSRQHDTNQLPDCQRVAAARGFEVVAIYREQESAVKRRPVFERLMADAHTGKFKVLILWRLDRLGRRMAGNINDVLALDRAGVEVVSVMEPWLDSGGPARNLLIGIFSWLAEEERRVLVERIHGGLQRARREGKTLGRPRTRPAAVSVRQLRESGLSWAQIASRLKCSTSAARRAVT